jgi:hypothetical protein
MPLNDDNTLPSPDRIIGGAGPFDFTGITPIAAVPISFKLDNGAVETVTINLAGALVLTAITAQEIVDAINVATPTDILASLEAVTGRVKIEYSGTELVGYLQVYGVAALAVGIGQGYGVNFRKSDTLKSFAETPKNKDEETINTTDAKGKDTEVITDGYRKGFTAKLVDTAEDWDLLSLIEGGIYTPASAGVDESYEMPTQDSVKPYFYIELFYPQYEEGSNKEGDLVSYVKKFCRSCKGSVGDKTHERGFADGNYSITGTAYRDENGVTHADIELTKISVEDFEALDVINT